MIEEEGHYYKFSDIAARDKFYLIEQMRCKANGIFHELGPINTGLSTTYLREKINVLLQLVDSLDSEMK